MAYFILSFLLLLFILLKNTKQGIEYAVVFVYTIFCIMLVFAGFRYGDADYGVYQNIYNETPSIFSMIDAFDSIIYIHGEIGFLFLNSIVKELDGTIVAVMVMSAMISLTFFFKSIKKYSLFPIFTIFLYFNRYFVTRDCMEIRACIACMIFIYATQYIKQKMLKKYFIYILIAASFHKVALICIPFYLLGNRKITSTRMLIILCGSFIVGNMVNFLDYFRPFIVFSGLGADYATEGNYYLEDLGKYNPITMLQCTILIVCLILRSRLSNASEYFNIFLNMYFISTVWLLLFHSMGIFASRVATIFTTSEVFILTYMPFCFSNKIYKYCMFAFISVASISFLYFMIMIKVSTPYDNVLFNWL